MFIEPFECWREAKAFQLLRVLRLKNTILETTISKVFLEEKKLHFIR